MIRASLFTALMILGAYIRIPIGPVPVTLSSFFVLLAGVILGSGWGTASVGIYLLLGALGLPVFTTGGGLALFAGPTGGYLLGFLPAAFLAGFIREKGKPSAATTIAALITGTIIIYLAGIPVIKLVLDLSWHRALAIGLYPFLPGDGLKIAAGAAVYSVVRRIRPEFIHSPTSLKQEKKLIYWKCGMSVIGFTKANGALAI